MLKYAVFSSLVPALALPTPEFWSDYANFHLAQNSQTRVHNDYVVPETHPTHMYNPQQYDPTRRGAPVNYHVQPMEVVNPPNSNWASMYDGHNTAFAQHMQLNSPGAAALSANDLAAAYNSYNRPIHPDYPVGATAGSAWDSISMGNHLPGERDPAAVAYLLGKARTNNLAIRQWLASNPV
jgi:hypothetical protein